MNSLPRREPENSAHPAMSPVIVACERPEIRRVLVEQLRGICPELIELPSLERALERLGVPPRPQAAILAWPDSKFRPGVGGPARGPASEEPAELLGSSEAMEGVRRSVRRVARTDVTVFLTGEPGSGRRQAARAIHQASAHSSLPFVAIDCGALSERSLDQMLFGSAPEGSTADRSIAPGTLGSDRVGTVLLSDIDLAPPPVQRMLLVAIEDRQYFGADGTQPMPVRVRLLASAATGAADPAGRLLPALRSRLGLMEIQIPPLRTRSGDLPELVEGLTKRLAAELGRPIPVFDPEAERAIFAYSWPGNVRELRNVLERTLVLLEGSHVRESDLPAPLFPVPTGSDNLRAAREEFEIQHVERVLLRHGGDMAKASRALGIDVSSIYRKLRRFRARKP